MKIPAILRCSPTAVPFLLSLAGHQALAQSSAPQPLPANTSVPPPAITPEHQEALRRETEAENQGQRTQIYEQARRETEMRRYNAWLTRNGTRDTNAATMPSEASSLGVTTTLGFFGGGRRMNYFGGAGVLSLSLTEWAALEVGLGAGVLSMDGTRGTSGRAFGGFQAFFANGGTRAYASARMALDQRLDSSGPVAIRALTSSLNLGADMCMFPISGGCASLNLDVSFGVYIPLEGGSQGFERTRAVFATSIGPGVSF